jgi:hypothetical protein
MVGTIILWKVREGLGLIDAQGRVYYAHASQFIGKCGCGQRHKCEIAPGMRVEFKVSDKDPGYKKHQHAIEIEVK